MDISILITVRNDLYNAQKMVKSLAKLKGEFEIVVVDAFSDDGTYEMFTKEANDLNIKIDRMKGNRAVGRNRCIELSTGNKFVFLDSDTEVPENWVESLRKSMDLDIVAGKIVQKSERKWADLGRVPIFYMGQDVTYPSNNLMYDRKVIEKIGKFDERFQTAEDIDLNIRATKAGYKISYIDSIEIYHYPRMTFFSLLKQSYYDGIGRKILNRKYGLKSSLNMTNIKEHPFIEASRLFFGMLGYLIGEFK